MKTGTATENAIKIIRERGGTIRASIAAKSGIHPQTLSDLKKSGRLELISRGVYRLAELPPTSNPDLEIVASRIPNGVICLISALAFHEITTQIPHEVNIALKYGAETPRIDYPPISVHRFSGKAFETGVEEHKLDGFTVRVYSPEKTIADCFKFRNKIGMDIVLEALKIYKKRNRFKIDELLKYAKTNRMERIMTPYLEAML
ncbi:MAG: type IV toxin-antitoxin system AbiEi family antitoxin domain-containing protein [Victivallaceae bacterium]